MKALISVLALVAALPGCAAMNYVPTSLLPERDHTSYHTPSMRIDAVHEIAARSTQTDDEEQRSLTDQLARQIQIESDPVVREAIIESIAEFRTPLAQQVLVAGLKDSNNRVREASCRALGMRGESQSVDALAQALQEDENTDVRLAAAEALGQIHSPQAEEALAVAVNSRDPALQYVGVDSLRSITGRDYGGDVSAWRQYVAGQEPEPQKPTSVAERLRRFSPF